MSVHTTSNGGTGGAASQKQTLSGAAQNIDLAAQIAALLPYGGMLEVIGHGPCNASAFANVEVNTVACTGHLNTWSGGGAMSPVAVGPIAAGASSIMGFRFQIDARAGARTIQCYASHNASGGTEYFGSFFNTDTGALSGLRILGGSAGMFQAGYQVTVRQV